MELRNVFGIKEGYGEPQINKKRIVFVNRLRIFMSIIVIEDGVCAARHSIKYLQLPFLKFTVEFTVTEKQPYWSCT